MAKYYNRASSLTGVRELASEAKGDVEQAMHVANLDMTLFNRPDERVDFAAINTLFEYCADTWGLPDLGLRLAPFQHLEILGPVALVTKIESNVRYALNAIIRNLVIHSDALICSVEECGDVASLSVDTQLPDAATHQYTLLSLGVARNIIEQICGTPVQLLEVSMRQNSPIHQQHAISRYFGCPVRMDAEHNALVFDRKILDHTTGKSDHSYHALIARYLNIARDELTGDISVLTRAEIARQMEFGRCTLSSVAHALRMEPRSLQRHLQRAGLSFRGLLEEWRKSRALTLVLNTRISLSEVSLALGYAEQSVFSRSFARWFGKTPHAYRAGSRRN